MRLYDLYEEGHFSQKEFIDALTLIESYILRRVIVGRSARDYWSVCARVAYAMESNFGSLQVALARLRDNNRFPKDDEFRLALGDRDIYALRICKHILNRLENAGEREPSPVGDYSIEHVMPQTIEDSLSWQHMLGSDWRDIHNTWLHRLGNLTLTAYNTRYSNKPFDEKKSIKGGLNQSSVRLNEDIRKKDKWTATEMQERSDYLTSRALEIWPNHGADQTQLQKAEMDDLRTRSRQRDSYSLEMSEPIRELLRKIQEAVHELGDIVETIDHKSVSCYGPGFFAELLPMTRSVRIILPLDYDEIEELGELDINDASDGRRVPNRFHLDCNLLVDIYSESEVAAAMPIIRQAFNRQTM